METVYWFQSWWFDPRPLLSTCQSEEDTEPQIALNGQAGALHGTSATINQCVCVNECQTVKCLSTKVEKWYVSSPFINIFVHTVILLQLLLFRLEGVVFCKSVDPSDICDFGRNYIKLTCQPCLWIWMANWGNLLRVQKKNYSSPSAEFWVKRKAAVLNNAQYYYHYC